MARRRSIIDRRQLTPSIVITSAILLVLAGALVGLLEEKLYRDQRINDVTVEGEILAADVNTALAADGAEAAQGFVNALETNPELVAVGVYDADGRRIAGFVRQGRLPLPDRAPAESASFADSRVVVVLALRQQGRTVGTVYLRAIADSLERKLVRYGDNFLLVMMGILLLVAVSNAQRDLAIANRELESRARDLAEANTRLQSEMIERASAEEALRQSQKMEAIGQLSGGIAHDFNNLITIAKGNLQLLQRRIAQGSTDTQRYIDSALESLNRGAALTQRILAFSRRQPLSPKAVDLGALVRGMSDLLRHSLGPDIEVETRLGADWLVLCDANQMENVILNLAINARDAMPNGGRFVVETDNVSGGNTGEGLVEGEFVRLRFTDSGIGMSEEVRARAIDPFFTTKPPGRGTGLGLSMTFGYVRQSNGYLTIDSAPGIGTTITILMPRYRAESVAAAGE